MWPQTSGAVGLQFALMLVPLMGLAGGAIDLARVYGLAERVQQAADSASIAAANAANYYLAQNGTGTAQFAAAQALAVTTANAYFTANSTSVNPNLATAPTVAVTATVSSSTVTVVVKPTFTYPTVFLGIVNIATIPVTRSSTAIQVQSQIYTDIYLMIDQSASMQIGASSSDVTKLRNKTGCAFACHDNNDAYTVAGQPNNKGDSFDWAVANGVTLKFKLVNDGITSFMDYLKTQDPSGQYIRVKLYSFDDTLHTLSTLTSQFSTIASNLPTPQPVLDELISSTHFNELIATVQSAVGSAGDGSTQAKSKKIFMLASDGVQDPTRRWSTDMPQLQVQVAPFDFTFCTQMKAKGVQVGILDTGYVPMTWDWGYNATVGADSLIAGHTGTRQQDLAPLMKACAGANYVDGSNSANIGTAFQQMFTTAQPLRIAQ